jgi:hypothetical protein
VFVGKVGVSQEALRQAFVLVLEASEDDQAGNDPKDAGVAVVDKFSKTSVLFLGSLHDGAERHNLAFFLGFQEVPLALFPAALVLLQSQH